MPDRRYFYDLLHTGKPAAAEFWRLGMEPLPAVTRLSFSGWDDATGMPTQEYYDLAAAGLSSAHGWVAIDHEAWPRTTKADRRETSDRFAEVCTTLQRLRPDLKYGFYEFLPRRDVFRARKLDGHADYEAWQSENDDMASAAAVVDGFFPSLYYFYNIEDDGQDANLEVDRYIRENIREARRMIRQYGDPNRPIYPYIWWMKEDPMGLLDASTWETIIEIVFSDADGCILWGGWQETWEDDAVGQAWWKAFTSRLPKTKLAGALARPTGAAGVYATA
jgi:hypothetical protein